jgi:hypothetical protein
MKKQMRRLCAGVAAAVGLLALANTASAQQNPPARHYLFADSHH